MKEERFSQHIREAVEETFEQLLFLEVQMTEDHGEVCSEHFVSGKSYFAKLNIISPYDGSVTIYISVELARSITESLYAGSEDQKNLDSTSDLVSLDALSEILNILAGRLMAKFVGDDQTYQIGLPQAGKCLQKPFTTPPPELRHFTVQDGCFSVIVQGVPYESV